VPQIVVLYLGFGAGWARRVMACRRWTGGFA
jgi:hypothetical protein